MMFGFSRRCNFNHPDNSAEGRKKRRKRKAKNRRTGEKAIKRGKAFTITDELRSLHESGAIYGALNTMNTNQLKCMCGENGILRGGPKYGLVNRLIEHAKLAVKKQKVASLEKQSTTDSSAPIELKICKFKSFEAAFNCTQRELKKVSKAKTVEAKFRILKGVSLGLDAQLLTAITGPRCGKYNGKYGELGIEANAFVAQAWKPFIQRHVTPGMSAELYEKIKTVFNRESPCEAYGFESYADIVGKLPSLTFANATRSDIVTSGIKRDRAVTSTYHVPEAGALANTPTGAPTDITLPNNLTNSCNASRGIKAVTPGNSKKKQVGIASFFTPKTR